MITRYGKVGGTWFLFCGREAVQNGESLAH